MDKIVKLEGQALAALIDALTLDPKAHTLRVCMDGDYVKFKINQGTWSPPMGTVEGEY